MTINNYWCTPEDAADARRIDHAVEAQQHIAWAHEKQEEEGDMGNVPRDNALLAQVHATLALVEQQRIANLIALSVSQDFGPDGANIRIPSYTEEGVLREEIAEGLGL